MSHLGGRVFGSRRVRVVGFGRRRAAVALQGVWLSPARSAATGRGEAASTAADLGPTPPTGAPGNVNRLSHPSEEPRRPVALPSASRSCQFHGAGLPGVIGAGCHTSHIWGLW